MGHPAIENETPFAFEPLLVADEEGRPIVAPIVKATFLVSAEGVLELADEQVGVDFAGSHHGKPGESSLRFEPETAFMKPATDVVLLGHAVAPRGRTRQMRVGIRVGPVQKSALVTGDRHWESRFFGSRASEPEPFARMPLIYERAFGGWDRTPENPEHHDFEPRNPVGVGLKAKKGKLADGAPLPNIESPAERLESPGGRPAPVGFGFVAPDWQPRLALAGTYDELWTKKRSPLLPKDFDRRFFNAAAEGLVTTEPLKGDEKVVAIGVTPEGRWEFRLPAIEAPRCLLATTADADQELVTNLDTVIVDSDERRLTLIWRTFTTLANGPHDLRALRITCANAPARAAVPSADAGRRPVP